MKPRSVLLLVGTIAGAACAELRAQPERALRVCADPNNLPFSNERLEGFENRIADVLAEELGAHVQYAWFAQRRGFIRNTLRAGACDLVLGIPASFELAQPTQPYYRSTYVFVTRESDSLDIGSLDDPLLRQLRVGVHFIGDDYANTPPAHALARRGIVANVSSFNIYGDYSSPNPPARLIEAVADSSMDVAIAWGPLAGYFAQRAPVPLRLTPVTPQVDVPFLPMVYDIAMGVRHEDAAFRDEIDAVLVARRATIDSILREFGVPRVDGPSAVVAR